MAPKPRHTIPRPSAPPSVRISADTCSVAPKVRRRRYVYRPGSLCLLLLLHGISHLVAFVLLTEPCLNPSYTARITDKLGYLQLLRSGAIPRAEWTERFTSAGVRGLFGVGVIQAWFTARLTAYVEKAEIEYSRLKALLHRQRQSGLNVGVDTRWQDKRNEKEQPTKVGNFIRQLESVSLSFLATPLMVAFVYALLVAAGADATSWKQTATLATHLALLIVLPLFHILGLPDFDSTPTSSTTTTTSTSSTTTTTSTTSPWTSLLTLHPTPSHLPLFYPPLFCLATTLVSTAILALDWNVSYQTYPFPLLAASLLGLALGDVYTILVVLLG